MKPYQLQLAPAAMRDLRKLPLQVQKEITLIHLRRILGMVGSGGVVHANTLLALQRLQSLAFGFGTFAYAKDRASLPHDGLLKDNPPPAPAIYSGLFEENKTRTFDKTTYTGRRKNEDKV
jgi:hypothetical protein